MTGNEIRIHDLAHPELSDAQKGAIAYAEGLELDFSVEGILARAREATGLRDFGSDDFLERLGLLVDEWGTDPDLTGAAHMTLLGKLELYARNRLLIHDRLAREPAIRGEEIERPIIVIGLPRSGTTHLLNLMASDHRLRSLPLWESYEPLPMPGEEGGGDGVDPRYRRCAEQWEAMQAVTPYLAAMHPMHPDHIHEELELMGPDYASYNFEWLAMSPRWRDHYYASDQTPHYRYMKTVLGILQYGKPRQRWVLKCPQHLEQIPVLLEVFPDATFAVTHRDPVSVIQSAVTMLAYGQRINRRKVELQGLIEYWSDRIEHLLRACVRDRALLPEGRSIDVPFREFMADDLAMVRRIYATADLEMTAEAERSLGQYVEAHPRGRDGRVVYDLKGDFGVDPGALRERFRFYFDHFRVAAEK